LSFSFYPAYKVFLQSCIEQVKKKNP
jgi:hypothetical protein